jgi:hypothetical protein
MRIGRSHWGVSLVVVLATGGLVAGCGGSSDSSTTTALSQAEFVAKATAICKPANARIEAAAHNYVSGGGPPTRQQFVRFATASIIPETQKVIDQFKDLTAPADKAQVYDALVAELQSVNDQLKADPSALQKGDRFEKANQLARQAGLDVCAAD